MTEKQLCEPAPQQNYCNGKNNKSQKKKKSFKLTRNCPKDLQQTNNTYLIKIKSQQEQ